MLLSKHSFIWSVVKATTANFIKARIVITFHKFLSLNIAIYESMDILIIWLI